MEHNFLKELLKTDQTVFSFKELKMRFRSMSAPSLQSRLSYYVKRGDLYHIRRGLYAKDSKYNRFELAIKIFTPSYISFETVLGAHGVTFQYYNQIFVASYQSREIVCDDQTYVFKSIKSVILTNITDIEITPYYSIASVERAFLDTVYLNKHYHFDNLEPLNWDTVYKLLPIYGDNQSMKQRVNMYYNWFKKEGGSNA